MLTREEAKKCNCAYLTMDKVHDVNMQILKEGGTKEELKQALTDWFESTRCKAENCPKWKDEFVKGNPCANYPCDKFTDYDYSDKKGFADNYDAMTENEEKFYFEHCLECDKHFGRCGV